MAVRRPTATFESLGLPPVLVTTLAAEGITSPFPIQAATLPDALAGRDVLGRGRTGSGKTYAFALPVLARLAADRTARKPGRPRALILAPTRELASQIETAMRPLADALSLRILTVFGGVGPRPQIEGLRRGVDVVIACPGRLADHLESGHVQLDTVGITVLDEADHMADLGFLPVVRRLLDRTPRDGQRLLFSATLDAGVNVLVKRYLNSPVTHSVDSAQSPVSTMTHHVLHVRKDERLPVLVDLAAAPGRTLFFTRTKRGAKTLTRQLNAAGVPAVELHGNLAQNARSRNLAAFADGSAPTMVATDIAARGIHVDDIGLVVHADPPTEHKAYLHRSGRTARAGADGTVITMMTDDQVADVRDLTRKAGITPTVTRINAGHPLLAELAPGERAFGEPILPAAKPARVASATRTDGSPRRAGGAGAAGRGAATGRPGRRSRKPSGAGQATADRRGGAGGGRPAATSGAGRPAAAAAGAGPAKPRGAAAFSAGSRSGGGRRGR